MAAIRLTNLMIILSGWYFAMRAGELVRRRARA